MEPEPQERHFNIQIEPQALAGVYANFANVSHSDYEFTITFARVDHDVEGPEVPGIAVVRSYSSSDPASVPPYSGRFFIPSRVRHLE